LYGGWNASKNRFEGVKIKVQNSTRAGEKEITIYKPFSKRLNKNDEMIVYKTVDYPQILTLREFAELVNADPRNNAVTISVSNEHGNHLIRMIANTGGLQTLGEITPGVPKLDGAKRIWEGTDGVYNPANQEQMQELYELLGGKYQLDDNGNLVIEKQGIYSALENYAVDQIALCDIYANTLIDEDNTKKTFARQLAQHCATATAKTWETIGFIAMSPVPVNDLLSVQEYVRVATNTLEVGLPSDSGDNLFKKYRNYGINAAYENKHTLFDITTEAEEEVLNEEGNTVDIGGYISVVFGPELGFLSPQIGSYVAPGISTYAAMISALSPEISSTNKTVSTAAGIRYNLSESQQNLLVGARYVTFQQKTNSNLSSRIFVKDGVTASLPLSDYSRLSTIRIIHSVVQIIRQKADPFIGLPNGLAQRNALSTEIQSALDVLKQQGVIQKFKFTIYNSMQDRVLGNAFITLEVVPQFEARKFNASVVLRAN
jgi:hypothetical protein